MEPKLYAIIGDTKEKEQAGPRGETIFLWDQEMKPLFLWVLMTVGGPREWAQKLPC